MISRFFPDQRLSTRFLIFFAIFFTSHLPPLYSSDTEKQPQEIQAKKYNWFLPSPQEQLDMEGLDDEKGMGRLFLPAMTDPRLEPVYTIHKEGELISSQQMGRSVLLKPGEYWITWGSGLPEQKMNRFVDVKAEYTTLIEPDWGGLVVEVMDETKSYIKEYYEIFNIHTQESYGIGTGADVEVGEELQTWILPPGDYKIVKFGESFNTFTNCSSFKLVPGELVNFTLVFNGTTKDLVGSGMLFPIEAAVREKSALNKNFYISGSFSLDNSNDVTSEKKNLSMLFETLLENYIKYEKNKHYFLGKNRVRFGWTKQEDIELRINTDRIESRNTYVYYIFHYLGLYSRLEIITKLFPSYYYFTDSRDVYKYFSDGGLEKVEKNVTKTKISPSLFPLEVSEGAGFNVRMLKSARNYLFLRLGMGFRQLINRDVYIQGSEETHFTRTASSYLKGFEISVPGNFSITRRVIMNSEFDVLFPFDKQYSEVLTWDNIINFKITRNFSLDLILSYKMDKNISDHMIQENYLLFRYTYNLF